MVESEKGVKEQADDFCLLCSILSTLRTSFKTMLFLFLVTDNGANLCKFNNKLKALCYEKDYRFEPIVVLTCSPASIIITIQSDNASFSGKLVN